MPWREKLKRYLIPKVMAVCLGMDRRRASSLCEIRMRAGRKVEFVFPWGWEAADAALSASEMQEQLAALTGYAMYRLERQMAHGYIPLEAGCRAGICGRMTREEDGTWRMTQVSSICLRISRSVPGAAKAVYGHLIGAGGAPRSVLILGPPGCGKTTVLRDAAEYLAETVHLHVAAADEREELFPAGGAAEARRIDVLAGCGKANGMMMLLRTMAPQVIVCDEIGSAEDAEAVEEAARCGAAVLASAHAGSMRELRARPRTARLFDSRVFGRYVLLGHMGAAAAVWDAEGRMIWEESGPGQLGCGGDGDDCGQRSGFFALGRGEAARPVDSGDAALSAADERDHPL